MNDLAASFLNAISSTLLHSLGLIPWWIWAGLAVAVVVVIAALRILTDWHVLLVIAIAAALGVGFIWYRQSLIAEGYAQAQPAIEAAKERAKEAEKRLRDAESCISKLNRGFVWDVSQKKCLSESGAIGGFPR